jgi:hypothetical protein
MVPEVAHAHSSRDIALLGGGMDMGTNLPALTWDPGRYEFQRKLGNFVQYFQINLPTNAYGVPLQLINPMMLTDTLLDAETTDDVPDRVVENAIMSIDFEEGMPLADGVPIWERFDGEMVDYYNLFKQYKDMLYVGGTRALAKLSANTNIEGKNLAVLSKVYHWQLRCKAYDAFKRMEAQRKRQYEIEKLESKHMEASKTLLEAGLKYLDDHPEQLNPKIALQMVQVAMKAGRLSLGLNADKPGSGDSAPSININQTSSGGGDMSTTVEVGGQDSQQKEAPLDYLQSIVHILDKSGALDQAKKGVIVDAEYSEIDDEPEAVTGT